MNKYKVDIRYLFTNDYICTSAGNLLIYSPGAEDEGVYQCVVSNSEGVVFSRVSKVR